MNEISSDTRTRPFISLYVVWHPEFLLGAEIANAILKYFRRDLYANVAGGDGIEVFFRSKCSPDQAVPIPVDMDGSETVGVIALVDENLLASEAWCGYLRGLSAETDHAGLRALLFPVWITAEGRQLGLADQAVRWDRWGEESNPQRLQRLIGNLTYQFCRMLRQFLAHLDRPMEEEEALQKYLSKVQVFLSHSKHDDYGAKIAKKIRAAILDDDLGLSAFLDVHDIPAGMKFHKVLLSQVQVSALVAIHTDSFSSREWCRREIIAAKKHHVPLVIADCIDDEDERGFPYLGNVPTIRLDPEADGRFGRVINRLLDEVLKSFLWRCRIHIEKARRKTEDVVFVPRPPELISLSALSADEIKSGTLVYPEPPLGVEEVELFQAIAPDIRILSIVQWLADRQ